MPSPWAHHAGDSTHVPARHERHDPRRPAALTPSKVHSIRPGFWTDPNPFYPEHETNQPVPDSRREGIDRYGFDIDIEPCARSGSPMDTIGTESSHRPGMPRSDRFLASRIDELRQYSTTLGLVKIVIRPQLAVSLCLLVRMHCTE